MKPALFVIDVQKDFYKSNAVTAQSFDNAAWVINAAIHFFREKKLPIVSVQHIDESDGLVPGQEGFEVFEKIEILPEDVHIQKKYGNAFNKTPLLDRVKDWGVDTVILTGYCAEYCVLSTYRGAKDLDLTPILLVGSLASDVPENIRFVESISSVVSLGALKKLLE
jgi:nicotinamidase-related amidase